MKKKSAGRKILRAVIAVVLVIVLIALCYLGYVLIDYHRIDDMQILAVSGDRNSSASVGEEYTIITYNIGFGAYTPDFGFFMDGGTESRAFSKQSVIDDISSVADYLNSEDADFLMIEEVDIGSTRSYQVEQREMLTGAIDGMDSVFAQNYDSPYLFYPIFEPHGKSRSGLLTMSKFDITSSVRRSLPIDESLMKLVDLDRCYSVSRVPVDNGKELILYTMHLSAYTADGSVTDEQLNMLIGDMQSEYDKGNYIICGGDFNRDLLGDSSEYFGVKLSEEYSWAKPFPTEKLENTNISLYAPLDEKNPIPSCRNADGPYHDGQFVVTVDGFMISDNVTVTSEKVVDLGFAYSDHDPVKLTFTLNG